MKAVLFDIYETLVTAIPQTGSQRRHALTQLAELHGIDRELPLEELFAAQVRKAHQCSPFTHPEVDVRKLWKNVLPARIDHEQFAADYEEAVHPTTPVANAGEIILKLHQNGTPLGIVSNAQAYTHDLLRRHLGEAASCFDPDLCVFSYELLRAKPDPHLFELAIAPLLKRGLAPAEILMIGDSPRNDIAPAEAIGLQTHLIKPAHLKLPDRLGHTFGKPSPSNS